MCMYKEVNVPIFEVKNIVCVQHTEKHISFFIRYNTIDINCVHTIPAAVGSLFRASSGMTQKSMRS